MFVAKIIITILLAIQGIFMWFAACKAVVDKDNLDGAPSVVFAFTIGAVADVIAIAIFWIR